MTNKIMEVAERVDLSNLLSKKTTFSYFDIWLVGDTPLITHAWSEKAKREMLQKQVKATKPGKELRDPEAEFNSSLYDMGNGTFGFPVTGVKKCILSAAHKDKGIPKTTIKSALWLDAEMTRVMPALSSAVCDMPLIRIYGSQPEMREDMVKIGGMSKTANFTYRSQFTEWALKVTGKINTVAVTAEALAYLISEAGMAYGIGEWRNERDGVFGAFHLGSAREAHNWDQYASGNGPLPVRNKNNTTNNIIEIGETA